jgi:hypothetical protein
MGQTISAEESEKLRAAFAEADLPETGVAGLPADIREQFCRNWATARQILEFLASLPVIPALVRAAIGMVIKAGDIAHRTLC